MCLSIVVLSNFKGLKKEREKNQDNYDQITKKKGKYFQMEKGVG